MMTGQEEKLSKFILAINAYAEEQRTRIIEEVEQKNEIEMKKAEDEVLSDSYRMIQKELADMRSRMRSDFCRKKMNGRNEILILRNEIEQKVFERAAEKINEYTKTTQYVQKLASLAQKIKGILCEKEGQIIVFLRPADMIHSQLVRDSLGMACEIKEDEDIILGGIIAANYTRGLLIDASLDTELEENHSWFAENSGLFIGNITDGGETVEK